MEHACYQCGKVVEDGVAFCPHCNAPQIRVAVAESQPATPSFPPGTPGEIQPPAQPVGFGYRHPETPFDAQEHTALQWRQAFPGILLAGIVAALAWMFPPIGYLLWPTTAGVLAVVLYHRRVRDVKLSKGAGARIGAMTGLFGFMLFAILMAVNLAAMGSGKIRQMMEQAFQQAAARNPNPEAQAMMQRLLTPEGVAVMFVIVLVVFLVLIVGFSSIGGAIGASLLNRKEPKS